MWNLLDIAKEDVHALLIDAAEALIAAQDEEPEEAIYRAHTVAKRAQLLNFFALMRASLAFERVLVGDFRTHTDMAARVFAHEVDVIAVAYLGRLGPYKMDRFSPIQA